MKKGKQKTKNRRKNEYEKRKHDRNKEELCVFCKIMNWRFGWMMES